MLRYQSRRHRFLMDESQQALADAAEGNRGRDSRIAKQILTDFRIHRVWESRHAELVLPVSEYSGRDGQLYKLRDIEVKLLHRRSLVRFIRKHGITGKQRDELLAAFYGPADPTKTILKEHGKYTLAVSSRVSTDHLINVMHDPVSDTLLKEYESIYSKYFELYCFNVICKNKEMARSARLEMAILRRRAMYMIKRIHSERPNGGRSNFDQEALMVRNRRFPVERRQTG